MTQKYFAVFIDHGEIVSTGNYIDGLVDDPIGHLGDRLIVSDSPIDRLRQYVKNGQLHDFPERPSAQHVWDWETLAWIIKAPSDEEIIATLTRQIQRRLDDFAKTRNYDGILSACTYATSTVPKFQVEGQYCVNARDTTWAAGYAILAEVQGGQRPVPTSIADFESDLPALEWPA